MNIVCLVDLDKKVFKEVGKINPLSEDRLFEMLVKYCDKYHEELKSGFWLFVATKYPDGTYEAKFRATYDEAVEEGFSDKPYYIDVAEHDERVLFHLAVNE